MYIAGASGCGSAGRVVDSETRDLWFEARHNEFHLLSTVCVGSGFVSLGRAVAYYTSAQSYIASTIVIY